MAISLSLLGLGVRHRIFTGEDGKEYQWRLRRTHSEVYSTLHLFPLVLN